LVHAALKGDLDTARREHLRLIEVIDLLFAEGNPGGIKEALKIIGICGNTVRLPLVNVSEATARKLYQSLADAEVVKL
jgi:4-hydroxy-tetrahydrodipicolinate synthase